MLIGQVESVTSQGVFVNIPALRTTYGPLSYIESIDGYHQGNRVAVSKVGPDEYIVVGVIQP